MLDALRHKARQLRDDPVLRRWLWRRVTGRASGEPAYTAHRPPYAAGHLPLAAGNPTPPEPFAALDAGTPAAALMLELPGERVTVEPSDPGAVFARDYADTETRLALHRFAWVPLSGDRFDRDWYDALWRAWSKRHAEPSDDWPWHPYTAAERVVNVLDAAERVGLPGETDATLALLARHGPAIAGRLEYFGDHHTGNHLSNNGRGLFRLGLALGIESYADLGGLILTEEAKRLFGPSGTLREGSTHYHFLLARNYLDAWRAARAHGRPEEGALRGTATRAVAAAKALMCAGGLPLVGDISPDCPPDYLTCIATGEATGWLAGLPVTDRNAVVALIKETEPVDTETLAADGWLRWDGGDWSGLWHVPPDGWPPMPGHGHQDLGSFEVHHGGEPVIVDPGRGAYGETGDAARFRSARAHNTLILDGEEPYPWPKPYYDDDFRRSVVPHPPQWEWSDYQVKLTHWGYARLDHTGAVRRLWTLAGTTCSIDDEVAGRAGRFVTRRLVTPLPTEEENNTAVIQGAEKRYRVRCMSGRLRVKRGKRFTAYGVAEDAWVIEIRDRGRLPWADNIIMQAL